MVEEILKRVEANDAVGMGMLGSYNCHGYLGLQQDHNKQLNYGLGQQILVVKRLILACMTCTSIVIWEIRGRPSFTWRPRLWQGMKGQETILDTLNFYSSIIQTELLSIGSLIIAASAGSYLAMHNLLVALKEGRVSRETIDPTLTAYNTSCGEMRSEARDAFFVVF